MQYSQEHLKTMVYAKFGGQTECIMGNSKIENRFNNQNNNFARASRFFVHFFSVTAWLRRENASFHFLQRKYTIKRRRNFLSLFELGYGS